MTRTLLLLSALLGAATAAQAQSPIRSLQDMLHLREGQTVHVLEHDGQTIASTLVRVVDDHFCVQFGDRETLRARCYPYTAIRAIVPADRKDPYYVIEVR